MSKKNVLVLYGGMSTEHEVSVVSALQVMSALVEAEFGVFPVYITKTGGWFLGDERFLKPESYVDLKKVERLARRVILPADPEIFLLRRGWFGFGAMEEKIDVVFPVFHGRNGEDGSIQGLLELSGLPYVGCGVEASSVGMDKYLMKRVVSGLDVNVTDDELIFKSEWKSDRKKVLRRVARLGRSVFVKPVEMGSSIGLDKVRNKDALGRALDVAFFYDDRVMVEKAIPSPVEVNIGIMGNNPYKLSVTEQPKSRSEMLSFDDKYLSGSGKSKGMAGADRLMPAKVSAKLIKEIESVSEKVFALINGKGIARVDYLINKEGELFFNEINTMPGSLSFYLWKKSGVSFKKLVSRLIGLAVEEWERKQSLTTVFESNILVNFTSDSRGKLS